MEEKDLIEINMATGRLDWALTELRGLYIRKIEMLEKQINEANYVIGELSKYKPEKLNKIVFDYLERWDNERISK